MLDGRLTLKGLRDEAIYHCFGISIDDVFTAWYHSGDETMQVIGALTQNGDDIVGWFRPIGDPVYHYTHDDWIKVTDSILRNKVELLFLAFDGVCSTLTVRCNGNKMFNAPEVVNNVLARGRWPSAPTYYFSPIFSNWPGNDEEQFHRARVGIEGLPAFDSNSKFLTSQEIWSSDFLGAETYSPDGVTPSGITKKTYILGTHCRSGLKLAVDGWQLELLSTSRPNITTSLEKSPRSHLGRVNRDNNEQFNIQSLGVFLRRLELFFSFYCNIQKQFSVVLPYNEDNQLYRCRLNNIAAKQNIDGILEIDNGFTDGIERENTWRELLPDFYHACTDKVITDAIHYYVKAGQCLMQNPDMSFIHIWVAVELLYSKFNSLDCEPGRLWNYIKRNKNALSEVGKPYQYVCQSTKDEIDFIVQVYDLRNHYSHSYSTKLEQEKQWDIEGEVQVSMQEKRLLLRFMTLVRALIIISLK